MLYLLSWPCESSCCKDLGRNTNLVIQSSVTANTILKVPFLQIRHLKAIDRANGLILVARDDCIEKVLDPLGKYQWAVLSTQHNLTYILKEKKSNSLFLGILFLGGLGPGLQQDVCLIRLQSLHQQAMKLPKLLGDESEELISILKFYFSLSPSKHIGLEGHLQWQRLACWGALHLSHTAQAAAVREQEAVVECLHCKPSLRPVKWNLHWTRGRHYMQELDQEQRQRISLCAV
jgi:hypothetical protein